MKAVLINYITRLAIFSLFLAVAGYALFQYLLEPYFFPAVPYLFVLFFFLSLLIYTTVISAHQKNPRRSLTAFMAASTGKLFLSLMIMVAWAFIRREEAVPFILTFAALYFAYTTFEVVMLLHYFRSEKEKG